jgi:hypothetical protein
MKTYGGVEVSPHVFLTSALDGGRLSASSPGRFTPAERCPATHLTGGWVGPRARPGAVSKMKISSLSMPEIEPRLPSNKTRLDCRHTKQCAMCHPHLSRPTDRRRDRRYMPADTRSCRSSGSWLPHWKRCPALKKVGTGKSSKFVSCKNSHVTCNQSGCIYGVKQGKWKPTQVQRHGINFYYMSRWSENLRETDHSEDLDIDGRRIREWSQGGKVWTRCIWVRIGTSGGLLWTR